MNNSFLIQSKIISGKNSLPEYLNNIKENNIYIIDSQLYRNSKYIKNKLSKIINENKKCIFFYDNKFEPSYQYLDKLFKVIKSKIAIKKLNKIIAVGGGSTMDTAKGIAILITNKGKSLNYRGFPKKINKPLDVVCVPSTVGTGSEVVYNASFIDEKSKTKLGINSLLNFPKLAILDPFVVNKMPFSVLASSGCDALVHSLEGFVSKKANQHSKYFSKKAYNLIMQNLPVLLKGKGTINNWSNMQWAAIYAIWGLSNSSSGPAGALSYYLGSNFSVPHGIAGACFIGKITRLNFNRGLYVYSELSDKYDTSNKKNINKKNARIIVNQVEKLLQLTRISQKLGHYGVEKNHIPDFVNFIKKSKEAFELNPIKFKKSEYKFILT